MSQAEPPYEPQEPKSGMSTGVKILLILLAVFGGLMLVCCGGSFIMFRSMDMQIATEPAEIDALKERLATGLTVPNEFTPGAGFNLRIPFSEERFTFVVYEGPEEPSALILASLRFVTDDPAAAQQEIEQLLQQQGQRRESIRIENYEEREFVVRGQPAKFYFGRGQAQDDPREFWQVIGVFEGEEGPTGFILIAPTETFDEARINSIIESIE